MVFLFVLGVSRCTQPFSSRAVEGVVAAVPRELPICVSGSRLDTGRRAVVVEGGWPLHLMSGKQQISKDRKGYMVHIIHMDRDLYLCPRISQRLMDGV